VRRFGQGDVALSVGTPCIAYQRFYRHRRAVVVDRCTGRLEQGIKKATRNLALRITHWCANTAFRRVLTQHVSEVFAGRNQVVGQVEDAR